MGKYDPAELFGILAYMDELLRIREATPDYPTYLDTPVKRIIRPGDTLSEIAANTPGVSQIELLAYNKIKNPDKIYAYQELRFPRVDENVNTSSLVIKSKNNSDFFKTLIEDIWANEDEQYDPEKKFYSYFASAEGGDPTIGPGLKSLTKEEKEYIKKHGGASKAVLDKWLERRLRDSYQAMSDYFGKDKWESLPDKYKFGILDMRHLLGSLGLYKKFLQAVKDNDLEGMIRESVTTWKDNGKTRTDTRRYNIRKKKYFFETGGKLNYLDYFK